MARSFVKHRFFLLVVISWLPVLLHAQAPTQLEPGKTIEREITGRQAHQYNLPLIAGQYFCVVVTQQGVDVIVILSAPDGKKMVETDSPTGKQGDEITSAIADITGDHSIVISPLGNNAVSGHYEIKWVELREAVPQDRTRIRAERLQMEAKLLDIKGAATRTQVIERQQEALKLWEQLEDKKQTANTLMVLGEKYLVIQQREGAIDCYERARVIYHELNDRKGEGDAYQWLGRMYQYSDQFGKALEYFQQALVCQREAVDKRGEARTLGLISFIYAWQVMNKSKSIEYEEQALSIYRELKDRRLEADSRKILGKSYDSQGNRNHAIEMLEEAASIYRELKEISHETELLVELKRMQENLSEPEILEYELKRDEKLLEFHRKQKDIVGEIVYLQVIGDFYAYRKKENGKALEYYNKALLLSRESNDRSWEASTLESLGGFCAHQKRFKESLVYYGQAIKLYREGTDQGYEGRLFAKLSETYHSIGRHDALAIMFGKQAVNIKQSLRNNIRNLDRESQQSFLKFNENTYRNLIDLLIAQGRLPEAEQVIRMLKEDEYFEYIRRDESNSPKAEKASLTPEEAALDKRYREIADQLTAIGTERSTLLDKKGRTTEDEQRLAKLEADLAVAGQAFQKFLDGLAVEMGKNADTNARAFQLRESQGLMEDLRELGKGVVALYTLVGEDKYRVILTTADFQKGYEYPIKAEELNRKVLAFRDVLQNPKLDPLPLAQELYKILVGPVAKDLQGTEAQMVMWSLDGVLRYLPVAALHDGKQYLVERYRTTVFTPASQSRLRVEPSRKWTVLGLGVTKAHGLTIPALPGVLEEMHGIIQEAGTKTGVLPGSIKLDEAFTQEAMLSELRKRNPVVHIASHFRFQPGNETNSALLLGDGNFLSLAQIKSLPNVFAGVDLLTLSACNTATGGSGASACWRNDKARKPSLPASGRSQIAARKT